jgi:dTDP-4-dehydrorhamnose reductase
VAAVGGEWLVLRTSWVYGLRGRNFLLTMRRLAAERDELRVVDDQRGAPTWSRIIAEATAAILAQCRAGSFGLDGRSGVYHLTCAGETTWYGFARAIFELGQGHTPRVVPITSADYPTPARRPAYSVLDNARLRENFGITLPDWREALALALES